GLTGAVGLMASWGLRIAGWHAMGTRYLLAISVAYLVFLGLLRVWLRMRPGEHFDFPNVGNGPGGSGSEAGGPRTFEGGGGDFGGGGASGSFDGGVDVDVPGSDSVIDGVLEGAGDGEGCLVVIPLALLAIIVLAALTVVWSAPTLFAEVLLDMLLAAGLYRRLRRASSSDWLQTALRRTAVPFLLTALLVGGTGIVLQRLAPQADTLGEAITALGG
ncbi:MAG: hypothetical protein ACREO3_01135, partial [Arenimonas sp.]